MSKKSAAARVRQPLRRERIVATALELLDDAGSAALSMRTVAARLGVEAMSLYRYVTGKDDLIAGVVDLVLSEIEVPPPGTPWREAMRQRALSARAVFLRHPAAALLLESCATMTPARLAYADGITGLLLAGGFDATAAYRAFLLLDSYLYGFTMQELSWVRPGSSGEEVSRVEIPEERYPHFAAIMKAAMATIASRGLVESYGEEFRVGLELVLDALARLLPAAKPAPTAPARLPADNAAPRSRTAAANAAAPRVGARHHAKPAAPGQARAAKRRGSRR